MSSECSICMDKTIGERIQDYLDDFEDVCFDPSLHLPRIVDITSSHIVSNDWDIDEIESEINLVICVTRKCVFMSRNVDMRFTHSVLKLLGKVMENVTSYIASIVTMSFRVFLHSSTISFFYGMKVMKELIDSVSQFGYVPTKELRSNILSQIHLQEELSMDFEYYGLEDKIEFTCRYPERPNFHLTPFEPVVTFAGNPSEEALQVFYNLTLSNICLFDNWPLHICEPPTIQSCELSGKNYRCFPLLHPKILQRILRKTCKNLKFIVCELSTNLLKEAHDLLVLNGIRQHKLDTLCDYYCSKAKSAAAFDGWNQRMKETTLFLKSLNSKGTIVTNKKTFLLRGIQFKSREKYASLESWERNVSSLNTWEDPGTDTAEDLNYQSLPHSVGMSVSSVREAYIQCCIYNIIPRVSPSKRSKKIFKYGREGLTNYLLSKYGTALLQLELEKLDMNSFRYCCFKKLQDRGLFVEDIPNSIVSFNPYEFPYNNQKLDILCSIGIKEDVNIPTVIKYSRSDGLIIDKNSCTDKDCVEIISEYNYKRVKRLRDLDQRDFKCEDYCCKLFHYACSIARSRQLERKKDPCLISIESINSIHNDLHFNKSFLKKFKNIETRSEDFICPICLVPFIINQQVLSLSCRHTFHIDCITAHQYHGSNKCPLCRQETNSGQVSRVIYEGNEGDELYCEETLII